MGSQTSSTHEDVHAGATAPDAAASGFVGQIPDVEPLLAEVIVTLALAADAYLTEHPDRQTDYGAAQIAIDVATASFERVKDRLRPEQRLSITQMLTETRLNFVRKRGT